MSVGLSDNCFMETCDNVEYWSGCRVVTISAMINAITDFRTGRHAVRSCKSRKSKICCTNEETDRDRSNKNGNESWTNKKK